MRCLRRLCATLALLAAVCIGAHGQDIYERFNGSCQQGGSPSLTNGIESAQDVQLSYPACIVTVFNHGAITKPTLYSDAAGLFPISNPFTATASGAFGFYAANGRYDIQLSGAGILTPFTPYSDITLCFNCAGSGGGASLETNGTPNASQTVLNFINGTGIGFTNTSGGNLQANLLDTTVTPGSYTCINGTVDAQGRFTAAASGACGGGGVTPGGSNLQLQYNSGGVALGGIAHTSVDTTTGDVQVDSLTRVRYANLDTNWSQLPAGTLTAGVQATVTLTPCPVGINGTDTLGKIYVSGVGTAEPVTLQGGGTCTSGAGSGTVKFTPANNHAAGYTLGSASSGVYEAMTASKNFSGSNANAALRLGPAGDNTGNVTFAYYIHGTVEIPTNNYHIDGHGALFICDTRDYCLEALNGASGPMYVDGLRIVSSLNINGWAVTNTECAANVTTITAPGHGFLVGDAVDVQFTDNRHYWGGSVSTRTRVSAVGANTFSYTDTNCGGATTIAPAATPGYANIVNAAFNLDYQGNKLNNIFGDIPGGVTGHFNNGIVVSLDEAAQITNSDLNGFIGDSHLGTNQCTAAFPYCGSMIYAPGPFSSNPSVVNIVNTSITVGCHGNGITNWYGNTLGVQNTVIQGFSQWGIYTGILRGGFGPTVTSNMYQEVGACDNPWYSGAMLGAAGVINVGRPMKMVGGEGPQGGVGNFGTGGGTTFYYYIVVHDSVLGVSTPFRAGQGSNAASQLVQWPRVPGTNTVTYDIIRSISSTDAPSTGLCTGGTVNACGSVALAQAQCATLVCSFTDNTTLATTAYTVTDPPTLVPFLPFWPGNIVAETFTLDTAASSLVGDCLGRVEFDANVNFQGLISTPGNLVPCLYSQHQNNAGTGNYGSWISSMESSTTSGTSASMLLNDINATANLKGRLNITRKNGSLLPIGEIFTFVDCDPSSTRNHNIKRPLWDACDMYIGNDVSNAALNASSMALGSAAGYNFYVNALPSGSNWSAHLDASLFRVKSTTTLLDGTLILNQPCVGCGPATLSGTQVTDNFNRADAGTLGANWTVPDGTWTILSNQAKNTSVGAVRSPAAYTGSSFSANQYAQVTIAANPVSAVGVGVRLSSVAVTGYFFVVTNTPNSGTLLKVVAGVATSLRSSCTSSGGSGDVIKIAVAGTTITPYTNGVVACAAVTDSAITSGSPGIMASGVANSIVDDFRAGNAAWTTNDDQTFGNVFLSGATAGTPAAFDTTGQLVSITQTCYAHLQHQADISADINSCYLKLGSAATGGIIDATGYPVKSLQASNTNPFAGANKAGKLLLGCYTILVSTTWVTPQKKFTIEGCSPGDTSPLGATGQTTANENTIFMPCDAVNSPAATSTAQCAKALASGNDLLFVSENNTAITTCVGGGASVVCTSTAHDIGLGSKAVVAGNSIGAFNGTWVTTATTANTFTFAGATVGTGNGGTVSHPLRQHGPFSAAGSGLTGANNYAAIIALGGQNSQTGAVQTSGTGPVGANWAQNCFGGQINNVSFDMNGNVGGVGIIGLYSGCQQERGGGHHLSAMNYGGTVVGAEGAGFMFDRNAYNQNDVSAGALTNGGPSHFEMEYYYADSAQASCVGTAAVTACNPAGVATFQGYCGVLAGYNSTAADDGGSSTAGGLAQFGLRYGTCRGLNNSGAGKSRYGYWVENYADGSIRDMHFENISKDPVYMHGTGGFTTQGWLLEDLDFASSSGSGNAIAHLDTGTDNNIIINLRGAAGANPAAIRDEVYGCGVAFGAAAPCIINGLTDGNPMPIYVQGGMNVYNRIIFGNAAAGSNATVSGGTGAPSGACVSGSEWFRTDGTINQYDCVNSAWSARLVTYNHSGTQSAASHIVQDRCTLGTDCSVTLTGSSVYTSSSSYDCMAVDRTAAAAVKFAPSSGSAFALTGTGTDAISYVCVGN